MLVRLAERGNKAINAASPSAKNSWNPIFHEILRRNHLHLKDMHRLEIFHVIVLL